VSAPAPDTVEIEPRAPADAAVVWMHGLGADAHDFESLVPELDLEPEVPVRFVFPNAPVRPVTINGGHRMRAWFDVAGFDRRAPQDERGIRESHAAVQALVERERGRGIAAARILVAGFSQGGAMALFSALRFPERLGGVVALSTFLPLAETLPAEAHPANAQLPVFMAHGRFDPIVPMPLGEASRDALAALGFAVEWHSYPMPHSVAPEEVVDLRRFLLSVLRSAPKP
jgi:phospholipase/carboxylesterase